MEGEKPKPETPRSPSETEAVPDQYQSPLSAYLRAPQGLLERPAGPSREPTTSYVLPGSVMPPPMFEDVPEIPKEVTEKDPEPKAKPRRRAPRGRTHSSPYDSPRPAFRASPATLERHRRLGRDGSQMVDISPTMSITEEVSSGSMGDSARKYAPRRRLGSDVLPPKVPTRKEVNDMLNRRRHLTNEWLNAQPDPPPQVDYVEATFRPDETHWTPLPSTSAENQGEPPEDNPPDDIDGPYTDSS